MLKVAWLNAPGLRAQTKRVNLHVFNDCQNATRELVMCS